MNKPWSLPPGKSLSENCAWHVVVIAKGVRPLWGDSGGRKAMI